MQAVQSMRQFAKLFIESLNMENLWLIFEKSDLLRDFSKELSALFGSVNSLLPIIENGLLFGSLRLWLRWVFLCCNMTRPVSLQTCRIFLNICLILLFPFPQFRWEIHFAGQTNLLNRVTFNETNLNREDCCIFSDNYITSKVMNGKTLVCKILSLLLTLKTFIPNFVAFFVFSDTASSCIFKISDSETLVKREFTPAILFLFGLHIIHSVGGE